VNTQIVSCTFAFLANNEICFRHHGTNDNKRHINVPNWLVAVESETKIKTYVYKPELLSKRLKTYVKLNLLFTDRCVVKQFKCRQKCFRFSNLKIETSTTYYQSVCFNLFIDDFSEYYNLNVKIMYKTVLRYVGIKVSSVDLLYTCIIMIMWFSFHYLYFSVLFLFSIHNVLIIYLHIYTYLT